MGLKPYDPLSPSKLAEYLEVDLLTPKEVANTDPAHLKQLLEVDVDGWSAMTLATNGKNTVIFNPKHSAGRQASDIMHELAHLLAKHDRSKLIISPTGDILRSFDEKQEDEANWLGGCLLLPRDALLNVKRNRMTDQQIIERYGVSAALLSWRVRGTGVDRQISRTGERRVRV